MTYRSVGERFLAQCEASGLRDAFRAPLQDGGWRALTWAETATRARPLTDDAPHRRCRCRRVRGGSRLPRDHGCRCWTSSSAPTTSPPSRPPSPRTGCCRSRARRSRSNSSRHELDRWLADLLGSAPIAQQVAKQLVDAATAGAPSSVLEPLGSGFTAFTDFAAGVQAFLGKTEPAFRAQ
jgi:hypothetical protein